MLKSNKNDELEKQHDFIQKVRSVNESSTHNNKRKNALVLTYGCQQNDNDSEKIKGLLTEMGYDLIDDVTLADLILMNTCAVREHAEKKVFGNLGALKPLKLKKPSLIIGICGCMPAQEHIAEDIKKKYKQVDMLFGTNAIHRLPEILYNTITSKERIFDISVDDEYQAENLPIVRDSNIKALISIMTGCNNYCSYCIVPYVRGRERSRYPENIINEVQLLVKEKYKDITLLGQNVNSYGNDLGIDIDFSDLLKEINELEGDFRIRFMTSHPKDATHKLIDTISQCDKVCNHLHLPFQAGNNRILELMNRKYTKEKYIELAQYAKSKIKNLAITSDVMVGFPSETFDEFMDTVDLIKKVEFDSLFTFVYSKRKGTPAENMEEQIPHSEKVKRFNILLETQNEISKKINDSYIGKTVRVLCEGLSEKNKSILTGRTEGNKTVNYKGKTENIGQFTDVKITKSATWSLSGEEI